MLSALLKNVVGRICGFVTLYHGIYHLVAFLFTAKTLIYAEALHFKTSLGWGDNYR